MIIDRYQYNMSVLPASTALKLLFVIKRKYNFKLLVIAKYQSVAWRNG